MSDRTGVQNLLAAVAVAGVLSAAGLTVGRAETVMQQCGQQYQAAKTANTLNGQTWNQFRTECAAKLKASASPAPQPGANPLKPTPAAVTPAPAPTPPPTVPASTAPTPVTPAPTTTTAAVPAAKPAKPASAGRVAFVARERQCGSEWKANKVTLVAQTPGLTWPKYLSLCNTRLKAAGQ